MGLTADDLKKHPQLARALVAYHTVLGVAAGPKEIFAKGDKVEVRGTAGGGGCWVWVEGVGFGGGGMRGREGAQSKITAAAAGNMHKAGGTTFSSRAHASSAPLLERHLMHAAEQPALS
jgi:hypothetical protein